jgi:Flp pilus assembly protein TadD
MMRRTMRNGFLSQRKEKPKRRVAAVLLVVLLAASAAFASEQSERAYSKGLIEFHAARYAEALKLFQDAVAADANDAYALYYRGVTRARLEDYAGAESDLRAAVALNPAIEQGALELGIVLVRTGKYEEALPWLEKAQRMPSAYAEASLYIGIAQLRLGRPADARKNFERAARDSALNATAHYYSGIAAQQLHDDKEAEREFAYVKETAAPDSAIAKEATRYLDSLQGAPEEKRYLVYGEVGFQYDTNRALLPSDADTQDAFGASSRDDGRAEITVGGRYQALRLPNTRLRLGYEIYQSLHFHETDFNLQDHRPSIEFAQDIGATRLGFTARYDFYLRQTHSFLQSVQTTPWLILREKDFGRIEVFYRMRWRGFFEEPFETFRDAWNHSPGARQLIYLGRPDRFLHIGYRFDREDPINQEGNLFAYDGHEVNGGFGWKFARDIRTELTYAWRAENYATHRYDHEHRLIFALEVPIIDHLSVMLAYFGAFNDSNLSRFTYDRNIGSLTFRADF